MTSISKKGTSRASHAGGLKRAYGPHGLHSLAPTLALLITLIVGLVSCDATSTVRFPTLTPTPTPIITEFTIPTLQSQPWGITPGPDGALWFTNQGTNQVSHITTSGVITDFYLPTPNSELFGIGSGPEGNLWFAENQTNQIGRITPQGAVIEIPIPTRDSFPVGITAGRDGSLWFTERNGNAIGRLDPARVK